MTSESRPARAPHHRVASEIDLPRGTAIWVLAAHLVTLLSPLALSYVAHLHWQALTTRVYSPVLLHVASALLMTGSAFEVAQNTVDKWYLTADTGSAMSPGFCDLLCYWGIATGMSLMAIAVHGDALWVMSIGVAASVLFPVLYLTTGVPYPGLAIAGLNAAIALFVTFHDPSVFLQLVFGTGMLMVFFSALLHTENQVLHGFTTLSSGVGFLAMVYSIDRPLRGEPSSVGAVVLVGAGTLLLMGALSKVMRKLPRTPRRSELRERAGKSELGAVAA